LHAHFVQSHEMLFGVLGAAIGLAASQSTPATLRVQVTPGPSHSPACEFWGDAMVMKVFRGSAEVITEEFCSAYGRSSARLITDNRGRNFVLLTYSEGHGTRATTYYLRVNELVGKTLYDCGRLTKSAPIGLHADLVVDFSVKTLAKGGIRIIGRSRVTGRLKRDETAPRNQVVSLTVN